MDVNQISRSGWTRIAGIGIVVGGVAQLAGGILETLDRALPSAPQFPVRTTAIAFGYLALALGLVALARARAVHRITTFVVSAPPSLAGFARHAARSSSCTTSP